MANASCLWRRKVGLGPVPAIDDEARHRAAGRLEVARQLGALARQRTQRPRNRLVLGQTCGDRFFIEIVQVLGELVDDLRLARDGERWQVLADLASEVHALSPDRIDARDALQRRQQLVPAGALLGEHLAGRPATACSSGGGAARPSPARGRRSSRGAPCGRASDRAIRREIAARRRTGRRSAWRSRSRAAAVPREPPGSSGRRCRASAQCVPPYMARQYSFWAYMARARFASLPAVVAKREAGSRFAGSQAVASLPLGLPASAGRRCRPLQSRACWPGCWWW